MVFPWTDEPNPKKMLREEITRQLAVMAKSEPDSPDYNKALIRYERLHEEELKEAQLREHRRSRIWEGIVTGALAGITLSAEQWTPLTSKWCSSFMRPFRSRRNDY